MMFLLGLTGSIGMGKSTTAQFFVDEGCALWDADAAVHRLYSKGGAGVEPIRQQFPDAVVNDEVDRNALKKTIAQDRGALTKIEKIVHPLVARDRQDFRDSATTDILVFDVPLLFETGGNSAMDAVACVSVSAVLQRKRVLDRGTMTPEQFDLILSKQMPDKEKRARADYVIVTDTLEHARAQVQDIVTEIRGQIDNA